MADRKIILFHGQEYDFVDESRLTWAEVEAIEKVTGMQMAEIKHRGSTCACGHGIRLHQAPPAEIEATETDRLEAMLEDMEIHCREDGCGCAEFASNAPTLSTLALVWVSMKRTDPTLTFKSLKESPMNDFRFRVEKDKEEPAEESGPTSLDVDAD